jgi:hypothetical protein
LPTTSSPTIAETDCGDVIDHLVDDSLIEQIWQDLGGQVPRERIRQIAAEAAAEFRTATVTAFVPVFVRRRTLNKLHMLIEDEGTA